jgi:hypothetical protein
MLAPIGHPTGQSAQRYTGDLARGPTHKMRRRNPPTDRGILRGTSLDQSRSPTHCVSQCRNQHRVSPYRRQVCEGGLTYLGSEPTSINVTSQGVSGVDGRRNRHVHSDDGAIPAASRSRSRLRDGPPAFRSPSAPPANGRSRPFVASLCRSTAVFRLLRGWAATLYGARWRAPAALRRD